MGFFAFLSSLLHDGVFDCTASGFTCLTLGICREPLPISPIPHTYSPHQTPLLPPPAKGASKTVTYDWELTWVDVNPDGVKTRPVIGINGHWPLPPIVANINDTVIVNVHNNLGNETTSIHYHGLYMDNQNHQDGPPGVTQCPIPPGFTYQYKFKIQQPGTYWYHSHSDGQVPDGLRGPILIHDPNDPYASEYEEEFLLTITDWYHFQASGPYNNHTGNGLIQFYLNNADNPAAPEPAPYAGLVNEQRSIGSAIADGLKYYVKPNKTYKIRIINMSTWSQASLHFDNHNVTIIEADGIYTEKYDVADIYIATAQRYSVLLHTKPDASTNYGWLMALDTSKFDPSVRANCKLPHVLGGLIYNTSKPDPVEHGAAPIQSFNDSVLVPLNGQPLGNATPDIRISLTLDFQQPDDEGQNRAVFNNITYIAQQVPSLFTAISTGQNANDATVYGAHINPFVIPINSLVEITIYNMDGGSHPIHLHSHATQLVSRTGLLAFGMEPMRRAKENPHGAILAPPVDTSPAPLVGAVSSKIPMMRDTWMIAPNTSPNPNTTNAVTTIRFKATNPGTWLLHCHMDWHIDGGLTATLIIAPPEIQSRPWLNTIPKGMKKICDAQKIPTQGNCAGNTKNPLDIAKCNTEPGPPVPDGPVWPPQTCPDC